MSPRAHRADDEKKRVAGQERHDDDAGLDEDDREQQRVDPGAVGAHEGREVDVDVQDEVEQHADEVHAGDYHGRRRRVRTAWQRACNVIRDHGVGARR
jgi:hypothetical protein